MHVRIPQAIHPCSSLAHAHYMQKWNRILGSPLTCATAETMRPAASPRLRPGGTSASSCGKVSTRVDRDTASKATAACGRWKDEGQVSLCPWVQKAGYAHVDEVEELEKDLPLWGSIPLGRILQPGGPEGTARL